MDRKGREFTVHAMKDGSYNIYFGDKLVVVRASQLNAYFGAPRWPSNRLQGEAMAAAKVRAEALHDDQH